MTVTMKRLTLAAIAAGMALGTPALSQTTSGDHPKGDHPERHCKPEKHNCGTDGTDWGKLSQDNPSWEDNPDGDHPERTCKPEREACPD